MELDLIQEIREAFSGWDGSQGDPTRAIIGLQKAMTEGGLYLAVNEILAAKRKMTLHKALGTATSGGSVQGISPLMIEDLSPVLTEQVFGESVPIFKRVKRNKAINITPQHNILRALGQYDSGFPFVAEGKLPIPNDSVYERRPTQIKFSGTLRAITDPAVRVSTGGGVANLKAKENSNGMRFLLHQCEQALVFAKRNCSWVDNVELGFDGLLEQHAQAGLTSNEIDMHGRRMDPQAFKTAALILKTSGKHDFPRDENMMMTDVAMFLDPYQASYVSDWIMPQQRTSPGGSVVLGSHVPAVQTQFGRMPQLDSVWLSNYRRIESYMPTAAEGKAPPGAPLSLTATAVAPGAFTSYWESSDAGVPIFYGVTGVGPNGQTAGVSALATATPAVNGAVDLVITKPVVGDAPMAYNIWRGTAANRMKLVTMVAPGVGASFTVRDLNYYMPGTTPAFCTVLDEDVLDIAELTPFFSMDLGIIDLSYRWVQMYYWVPRLKNAMKMVVFRNCGAN